MKKFLSLVLALVMTMSLVTISAGAKDFTDNDSITYDEAVAVVSEVGIVDGYADGKFNPTNTLTRQAAAKIICNLILGPTTAAELHADTAPYKDVPANGEFAGYIAYCAKRGIISGYADGTFRPGGTLTGYAFMKMLLGALGYDATLEGYVGANWSINVAKQALGIGLNKGLEGEFNGIKAVTREEACLYAFRTLQADLVEYGQRLTTNINGTEVTLSSGGAQTKKWGLNQSQQTRVNNIREDDVIQFAEEYFRKLEKKPDTDDFERPAYTWIYDKNEIGTYVDWEIMVEEYTDEVTGRDLYDLLGLTTLRDNDFVYYVDGVEPVSGSILPRHVAAGDGSDNIAKDDMNRSNQKGVGTTGRGVLTQVFVDKDKKLITMVSIDTWLSKATANYDEKKEFAPVNVYTAYGSSSGALNWNIDVEDVPSVVDVEENDFLLVNISWKENTKGIVVKIGEPEVLEQSVVTKFSANKGHVGGANSHVTKLTTDGTEYKNAVKAFYDDQVLNQYDETLLTDKTYNIYLDPYGNFIGVDLFEGELNYVFITGFDRPTSNISISTANASAIFLDGTMDVIKVNVSATNKNIKKVNGWKSGSYVSTDVENNGDYFIEWNNKDLPGEEGSYRYNRWFTYSVNEAGTYTLKPATRMNAHKYTGGSQEIIRTSTVYLDDNVMNTDNYPYGDSFNTAQLAGSTFAPFTSKYNRTSADRSYGNDDSVFITVDMDIVDTMNTAERAITEVNGVYTGVQNVEIEIDHDANAEEAEIYTVYNKDHYIIGAVTVGEGKGGNATVAYVLSGAKSERKEGDTYYWEFDAVVEGVKQTLTAKSKYHDIFDVLADESNSWHEDIADGAVNNTPSTLTYLGKSGDMNVRDGLVELRYDADKEYVVGIRSVEEKDIYNNYGSRSGSVKGMNSLKQTVSLRDVKAYRINGIGAYTLKANSTDPVNTWSTSYYADSAPNKLYLQGRTLYVTAGQQDEGLALTSDAKAVVIQRENGDWETTEYTSVQSAITAIADWNDNTADGLDYMGEIVAAVNSAGAATWVVFTNYAELKTGTNRPIGGSGRLTLIDVVGDGFVSLDGTIKHMGYWDPAHNYVGAGGDYYGTAPATYGAGYLTYELVGSAARESYDMVLEVLSGSGWTPYATWKVTAATSNFVDRHYVGVLNPASQWRITCGDVTAAVSVLGR
ncbi:S-layer homology domain-containing protein [Oscillibacter sp.]|uniref:S-layer homology domain-containing protein n=1 Tax=Oscillibacter sp. TaxID=1945593 RepID=UPI002898FAAD|nr:S-layer homology domain-containing protein [Oscillibacter sp.]